jgi:hypothetical protein
MRESDASVDAPQTGVAIGAVETQADHEARNPFFRYLMHLGLPVSASLVLHALIVAFMAVKVFQIATRPEVEVGEWSGAVVEAADLSKSFNWNDQSKLETPPDDAFPESLDDVALPMRDLDVTSLSNADKPGPGAGDGNGLGLGDGSLSLLGQGSGAGDAGTGGFGSGLGGGGARIGQAGIWNLSVRANKIVYVVDFSGSIIVAVDDLRRELKRSVGALKPSQSFDVVLFYSSGGGPDAKVRTESFRPKLEPAEPTSKREFLAWIDKKAPSGETEPLEAMKRAIAMQPDAIFFFSDGFFDDKIVDEIERANKVAKARIYCLVFDEITLQHTGALPPRETEGARRLKRIAEANRGQVKIVTGNDVAR